MSDRRYQMTRVRAGDYLLPSNDLQTIYRISSYEETGLGEWKDEKGKWHKIVGTYWQVAEMSMSKMQSLVESDLTDDEDILDWNEWESYGSGYGSRKAAIEDVLR